MGMGEGTIKLWSGIPSQAVASCRGAKVGIIDLLFVDKAPLVSSVGVG